jgi:hypothetical protein
MWVGTNFMVGQGDGMCKHGLRSLVAVIGAGVIVAGNVSGGSRAWAAEGQIPSAAGVIYACVRVDKDGDAARLTRLVAADEACRKNEVRVQWSVTGPQGAQGAQGASGAQGLPGVAGPQGAPGSSISAGAISGQLASCVPGATLEGYLVHIPGRAFTAITGADGAFQFDNVPPGGYDVSVKDAAVLVTQVRVEVSDSLVILPDPLQLATCAPPPPPPVCETTKFFRDADADGFGDPSSTVSACERPPGFTLIGGDCDDTNHRTNPVANEIANGIDDNCNGTIDEGFSHPPQQ